MQQNIEWKSNMKEKRSKINNTYNQRNERKGGRVKGKLVKK